MHCVCVEFRIREGEEAEFGARVARHAAASRETEEGCLAFDVWTDPATPLRFFLYEVYRDLAAFEAHRQTAHFIEFDAKAAPLAADKTVARYNRPVAVAAAGPRP